MTKDEERKQLVKIEKLIKEAGEDSYIGVAFRGCVDNARWNIDDDAAYSSHDYCNDLLSQIESLKNEVEMYKAQAAKATDYYNRIKADQIADDDILTIHSELMSYHTIMAERAEKSEQEALSLDPDDDSEKIIRLLSRRKQEELAATKSLKMSNIIAEYRESTRAWG